MKKGLIGLIVMISMAVSAPYNVQAANVWDMADERNYGRKAAGMFGRGLINAVTSPVDTIVHTVEGTQEGPPLIGTLTGVASGIGCTALRASSGIIDVVTFWVPGFNGFKVSRSYSNCLEEVGGRQLQQAPQPVVGQPVGGYAPTRGTDGQDAMSYVKRGGQSGSPMDYVKRGRGTGSGTYIK